MKIFGHQLDYAAKVFDAHRRPVDCGADDTELKQRLSLAQGYSRVVMQILVSLIILAGCFAILWLSDDQSLQKGSFGLMGTVIGYWLR
ncbi:hypothetical protein GCM10009092_38840 [Bowmanella denitrificans]|uniref:Uncharacterized protein n=1 Tax=Bowmanella denitrificans TaxID=366582 RepID=A0ABN0XR58_9ALTE